MGDAAGDRRVSRSLNQNEPYRPSMYLAKPKLETITVNAKPKPKPETITVNAKPETITVTSKPLPKPQIKGRKTKQSADPVFSTDGRR